MTGDSRGSDSQTLKELSGGSAPGIGYVEQFTAFIDFLGFSEISKQTDDKTRLKVLDLLLSLSALRSEFDIQSKPNEVGGKQFQIRPAISTFSDHIVISFPLDRISGDLGPPHDDSLIATIVLSLFGRLLRRIAASALRLGLLIRGGATIGKLYHSQGVVFGEAMIEAFEIESRIAVYPRIVLSPIIVARQPWVRQMDVTVCNDGLHHYDYFRMLIPNAVVPGNDHSVQVKTWVHEVVAVIAAKLSELRRDGRLNELAKWTWFSQEFRRGAEVLPAQLLASYGISLGDIRWAP